MFQHLVQHPYPGHEEGFITCAQVYLSRRLFDELGTVPSLPVGHVWKMILKHVAKPRLNYVLGEDTNCMSMLNEPMLLRTRRLGGNTSLMVSTTRV